MKQATQYWIASSVAARRAKAARPTMRTRTGAPTTWMTTLTTTVSWIPKKANLEMTMEMDCQIMLIVVSTPPPPPPPIPMAMASRMRLRARSTQTVTASRISWTWTGLLGLACVCTRRLSSINACIRLAQYAMPMSHDACVYLLHMPCAIYHVKEPTDSLNELSENSATATDCSMKWRDLVIRIQMEFQTTLTRYTTSQSRLPAAAPIAVWVKTTHRQRSQLTRC